MRPSRLIDLAPVSVRRRRWRQQQRRQPGRKGRLDKRCRWSPYWPQENYHLCGCHLKTKKHEIISHFKIFLKGKIIQLFSCFKQCKRHATFNENLQIFKLQLLFNNYYSPLYLRWQQRFGLCKRKKKKMKMKNKKKQNLFSRSPSLLFFIWFLTAQSPTIFLATFLVLLHTSAGNFDVCSRQSNGRHSHVETDVIIEKKALIGRGPILHEGFFFDADWRLRTVFVNFITTITVSFLTFLFLPFTSTFISSRFAIFVLFIGK